MENYILLNNDDINSHGSSCRVSITEMKSAIRTLEFVGIRYCSEAGVLTEMRFREGVMWSSVYGVDFGSDHPTARRFD